MAQLDYKGVWVKYKDIALAHGVTIAVFMNRVRELGWSPYMASTTPPRKQKVSDTKWKI